MQDSSLCYYFLAFVAAAGHTSEFQLDSASSEGRNALTGCCGA
jgi:hypothetical protein